jgi:DNA-binding NarL/FixJ family response regulator
MGDERRSTIWVDDSHAIFRRGLVACLSSSDLLTVGQSARLRPVPRLDSIDLLVFEASNIALREVVRLNGRGHAQLLAILHDVRETAVCDLLEAGVHAVLPRADLTAEVLLSSVRAVIDGAAVVPATIMPRVLHHARITGADTPGHLNDRERDVLKWLAEGSDTREIALELCFSERTVKNVVHDILVKLNCRTRAHAVALATRSGVI